MSIQKETLNKICSQVYRKFPAVKNSKPAVKAQPNGDYLLIFSSRQKTANGHAFPLALRVVADEHGKIKKISTSK